jgi:phage antirepressor YoqD-like protein
MNNIIVSQKESATITSYDLWKKLNEFRMQDGGNKSRHDDFLARVIDECDDLGVCEIFAHPSSGVKLKYYKLTHEQALLVGMRESKAVRKKVLNWIKLLESKQQFKIPQTLGEALQLAADQAKQLELQAPKVAFVDNCVERGQLMTATQVAQKHKMSAVKLNKFLDEIGGVYSKSVKRSRVFIQSFIDNDLGQVKQTELGHSQALFTAKGEQWINEKLINEGEI